MSNYGAFLEQKTHRGTERGFVPESLPDFLFDFQRDLVAWALQRGRGAIFADCGMGKTPMQLVWADQVARHTGKRVLVLTPLAVTAQTIAEGHKFGIEAVRSSDGTPRGSITVTNYERLHHFSPADFGGVVCDESSILKSFDGQRRAEITNFMRKTPYRLLATATAAPNDHTELGTSSEAIGEMGHVDMLSRFFKNDQNHSIDRGRKYGKAAQWRFKGHAERPFWRWVCSWARAIRRPSDYGYDDGRFILPPLQEQEHIVQSTTTPDGMLFALPAVGMREERDEVRRTIQERCEYAASLVRDTGQPAILWCNLNDEGDLLESLIPGAVQVAGRHDDEDKEARLLGFARGESRVLITKPKIGAWGLNLQHCAHVVVFPTHSFEQYYQSVRRCWRFGQTRPVTVDVIATEGSRGIMENLQQKMDRADHMFSALVTEMNHAITLDRVRPFPLTVELPAWLAPS